MLRFAIALTALACATAAAQTYPQRPVRMIVGLPAGGSTDIMARMVAARLTERLGQQVVVDNRPGGNGIIGIQVAVNAQPDGHTLIKTPRCASACSPRAPRCCQAHPPICANTWPARLRSGAR